MDDDIGIIDEFCKQLAIFDVIQVILQAPEDLRWRMFFDAAG